MRHMFIPAAASVGTACLLVGCISGSADVRMSGRHIGAETISQIEPGTTTRSWVRATMGEPTSIATATNTDGESEIWRYEWHVKKKSSGYVFPVVAGSANVEYNGAAFVEFADGIVVRAWRDSGVSEVHEQYDDDDCDHHDDHEEDRHATDVRATSTAV